MFLNYIDQKAEYLKKFSRPLNRTETKKIATLDNAQRGKTLTTNEFQKIKEIAQANDDKLHKEVDKRAIDRLKK